MTYEEIPYEEIRQYLSEMTDKKLVQDTKPELITSQSSFRTKDGGTLILESFQFVKWRISGESNDHC